MREARVDTIDVDAIVPSPSTINNKDEGANKSNDGSSMADALDKESINLFVDSATMDLDMDSNTCRDLLANES